MARGRSTFRQADVKRALMAAMAAGVEVERIEIDPADGKITLIVGKPDAPGRTGEIVL